MASIAQPVARGFSSVFGLLMVGTAIVGADGLAVVVGIVGAGAVAVGIVVRPAATVAVLVSVSAIVVSDQSYVFAALSGLCAAGYLVSRYAVVHGGFVLDHWPTIVAAVGFTFAGVVATSFPLQVPWLPLLAPLAVLAIYVLATRPFLS
ncbi:hypothetical protein [Mycobacterium spongiae]|uniref:Integral membrane protein n=1 Tax=Mycobacterium spongiae TaxID=886343 RepID=A0A975JVZ2_9MYCO|nr:hypothetical protein [Mycobacterium spongiae]QUR66707.1 hypothetical protein F6B93_05990 [Mycobacterium spongiae]